MKNLVSSVLLMALGACAGLVAVCLPLAVSASAGPVGNGSSTTPRASARPSSGKTRPRPPNRRESSWRR